jgi:tetratricopeptide (TPR) repeat protein
MHFAVSGLEFPLASIVEHAGVRADKIRRAVITVSAGEWEPAIAAWSELAVGQSSGTAGCAKVATAMMCDAARRCGRLDIVANSQPLVDAMFDSSAYLSAHHANVAKLSARRRAASPPSSINGLSGEDLRHHGRKAIDNQLWTQAVAAWSACLLAHDGDAESHRRLGQSHAVLGAYPTAVVHLSKAMQRAPDDWTAQALDRATRLTTRRGEAFFRHAKRFAETDVIVTLRDGLASLLDRDLDLTLTIAEELRVLSEVIAIDLLALTAVYVGPVPSTSTHVAA